MSEIFDNTLCELGEGPLWHPKREELFWFDILNKKLFAKKIDATEARTWDFDEYFSAAGWVDYDTLMIASETALWKFDIETGNREKIVDLEADNPVTRSNDGRADPLGGFWIGTMGKSAEREAGAIYRYYRGELRKLFGEITISNSICFAPNGKIAYYTDTTTQRIMRVDLDDDGWPSHEPEVFVNLRIEGRSPDGSIVDSKGNLLNAQWGAGVVAAYSPAGEFIRNYNFSPLNVTCPAFGGPEFMTLFVTSARDGRSLEEAQADNDGAVFKVEAKVAGLPEPRVILGDIDDQDE